MNKIINLLKDNKLPLLFRLISKRDLYPLERKNISVYSSKKHQTKLCYSFSSSKPIAKILDIKDGKIL